MNKVLLAILFSISANACIIKGASSLIVFGKDKKVSFDQKNCSEQEILSLSDFIRESEGTISNQYLKRIPELSKISITPNSIRIRNLEDIVHDRLNLKDDQKVELLQQEFSNQFYKLASDEFLEVYCSNCSSGKVNNFKIVKTNGTKRKTTWVKGKILTAVKTFIANKDIQLNFSSLNKSDFTYKTVYVSDSATAFSDMRTLLFHRLNKTIRRGHILKTSDLTPIQLVKYGTPVSVTVSKKSLRMKLMASPLDTGKLGDTVKLKNRNSKKIFYGTVTGINKVKVEL